MYTSKKNILVYDLGGGTFDVSLLRVSNVSCEVLCTNGDTNLGGTDFDNKILQWLRKTWIEDEGVDIFSDPRGTESMCYGRAMYALREKVEMAKCRLSTDMQATIELDFCQDKHLTAVLTRPNFEKMNAESFSKTIDIVDQTLKNAHLNKTNIDEVLLVGGSSKIVKIRQLVRDYFNGREPAADIDPDEAVAYGAAVQAFLLSTPAARVLLHNDPNDARFRSSIIVADSTPLSIGVMKATGEVEPVILRGTRIPCTRTQLFTTKATNQDKVHIQIYEGENKYAKDNHLLGDFDLVGIAPAPQGVPQIEVTLFIDANSILSVTAEETNHHVKESRVIISKNHGLSEDEIKRIQKEAEYYDNDKGITNGTLSELGAEDRVKKQETLTRKEKDRINKAVDVNSKSIKRKSNMCLAELKAKLRGLREIV